MRINSSACQTLVNLAVIGLFYSGGQGALASTAAGEGKAQTTAEASGTKAQQAWTRVENKRVCMVTNAVFSRDQIPVEVSGKTYYGCCENCKNTLSKDESVRFALDPITQKKVDKATAVIAASDDGSVLYFENEASFKKFVAEGPKAPI